MFVLTSTFDIMSTSTPEPAPEPAPGCGIGMGMGKSDDNPRALKKQRRQWRQALPTLPMDTICHILEFLPEREASIDYIRRLK